MKKIYAVLAVAVLLVAGVVYMGNQSMDTRDSGKIQVAASFYPLYYFASAIGGDKAEVYNFTPSGVEPHDYEPTPRDIARLEASDLLILNGAGLEPWAANIRSVVQNDLKVAVVGEEFATLRAEAHEDDEEEHEEGEEEEVQDPHVWLAPLLAKQEANLILKAFIEIDPANREYYEKNSADLNAKLDALDIAFRDGLKTCEQRKIVTSHAAFGYMAAAYDLEQIPISGISPNEEPSLQDLARISEFARNENIRYIFFEALVSPKLAETIAREVGAQTLVLDPIESGTDYFAHMYSNLENLRTALGCQK